MCHEEAPTAQGVLMPKNEGYYSGQDAIEGHPKVGTSPAGASSKRGSPEPSGRAVRPVPPRLKHRHGLGAVGKDRARDAARLMSRG